MLATNKEFLKLQREKQEITKQQWQLSVKDWNVDATVNKLLAKVEIPVSKLKRGDVFIQKGQQTMWWDNTIWNTCYGIGEYKEVVWYLLSHDRDDFYSFSPNAKVLVMRHEEVPESSVFEKCMRQLNQNVRY